MRRQSRLRAPQSRRLCLLGVATCAFLVPRYPGAFISAMTARIMPLSRNARCLAEEDVMADVEKWSVKGQWFDVCRCAIPCPCSWAQPPDDDFCEGILVWHIQQGRYGNVE